MTRTILILTDLLFAATVIVIRYTNEDFNDVPLFLKFLIVVAFASCIIRHINYYKHNKKIF